MLVVLLLSVSLAVQAGGIKEKKFKTRPLRIDPSAGIYTMMFCGGHNNGKFVMIGSTANSDESSTSWSQSLNLYHVNPNAYSTWKPVSIHKTQGRYLAADFLATGNGCDIVFSSYENEILSYYHSRLDEDCMPIGQPNKIMSSPIDSGQIKDQQVKCMPLKGKYSGFATTVLVEKKDGSFESSLKMVKTASNDKVKTNKEIHDHFENLLTTKVLLEMMYNPKYGYTYMPYATTCYEYDFEKEEYIPKTGYLQYQTVKGSKLKKAPEPNKVEGVYTSSPQAFSGIVYTFEENNDARLWYFCDRGIIRENNGTSVRSRLSSVSIQPNGKPGKPGESYVFDFDTTTYASGTHTIQWAAVDGSGRLSGIGSRFFTIQNSSAGADAPFPDVSRKLKHTYISGDFISLDIKGSSATATKTGYMKFKKLSEYDSLGNPIFLNDGEKVVVFIEKTNKLNDEVGGYVMLADDNDIPE